MGFRWSYIKLQDIYIIVRLQKNIIKILKEETQIPLFIRRRIDSNTMEKIFKFVIKTNSHFFREKKSKLNAMTNQKFHHMVISDFLNEICDDNNFDCENSEVFNKLWEFLSEYYSKRITKIYYDIIYEN